MKQPKKGDIHIRVSEATKIELQLLADAEKRLLSEYLRIELEKLIAQKKQTNDNP